MRVFSRLSVLAVACFGPSACADSGAADGQSASFEQACGVVVCSAADDSGDDFDTDSMSLEGFGKADAADKVEAKLYDVVADGELGLDDVRALFEAAGGRVSRGELQVIGRAIGVFEADPNLDFNVTAEALGEASFLAWTHGLHSEEVAYLRDGYTFGGTEIPDAVAKLVVAARFRGAVAYDVNEQDEDGEGIWSPYPSTTPAEGNMAWDYTEITPEKLIADALDADVVYNAIIGTEEATTASGQTYQRARYEERTGGTGNILAHYDEVYHPDIYARGSQGQKWANNFAILADGSIHCLPAARRSPRQDLILTNPALSRGAHVLYNGHLDVRAGVVEGVEMSGRLSKMAAKGKAIFIDPIALLEAWGFEISDRVSLRYGNTSKGRPVQQDGVVMEAPESDVNDTDAGQ